MNALELFTELLSKRPKEEIESALLDLMVKKKLDFLTLNTAYIRYLNEVSEENKNKIIEAGTCLMLGLLEKNQVSPSLGKLDKLKNRIIYFLDQIHLFNLEETKKSFDYNEEVGKEESWLAKQ